LRRRRKTRRRVSPVPKAAPDGDAFERVVGRLQLVAGELHPHPLDEPARRLAHLRGEDPGEVPHAHAGGGGPNRTR